MGVTNSDSSPAAAAVRSNSQKDLRNLERVRAIFTAFSKYINAKTIYTSNNPNVGKFAGAFFQSFQAYFEHEKELQLTIEQYRITWNDEIVYENTNKTESIAFLLYKDGVGELIVQPSIKPAELDRLADLIKHEIHNPSSSLDIVSKLWEADFSSIFYRVYDENTDGSAGEGRGAGSESREKPLQADDHKNLPFSESGDDRNHARSNQALTSLGTYLYRVIERNYPGTSPAEKEQHIQSILECLFTISVEEFTQWQEEFQEKNNRDKLLWLLNIMLDFTQAQYDPATVRDILDIIDRLVRFIIDESNIQTLTALLHIQRKMSRSHAFTMDFRSLPERLEHELTNTAFMIALGRTTNRTRVNVQEVLRYFQFVGRRAVPGVCELLTILNKDPGLHKEACDILLSITGDDLLAILDTFNLDNPYEARDAVYLLHRSGNKEIPPLIRKLLSSSDVQVRECVIEYLAAIGSEEAAQLLIGLLEDPTMSVRMKTLAAVENFRNPLIVEKVCSLCFSENIDDKHLDELERLFRTLGKLGGEAVLAPIKDMMCRKNWLPFSRRSGKQNKLLAITALRFITGDRARALLEALADSRDKLVRTKARYVLKRDRDMDDTDADVNMAVGCGETEC